MQCDLFYEITRFLNEFGVTVIFKLTHEIKKKHFLTTSNIIFLNLKYFYDWRHFTGKIVNFVGTGVLSL